MAEESSPPAKKQKSPRGQVVNNLTLEQLQEVVDFMKSETFSSGGIHQNYVVLLPNGKWKCTLACTKSSKGEPKYPQLDLHKFSWGVNLNKQLVHLIWWRWVNKGALLNERLTISHLDKDNTILHLTEESVELNESRKYCHLFGWYKPKPGEDKPRCPHWEVPCTGP